MVLAEVRESKPNHANAFKTLIALCLLIAIGQSKLKYKGYSLPTERAV